jgi:tRNA(Arg) A34 adenosine deaminase TadA
MLNSEQISVLTALGDSAIQTLDVPVAALVLYDNKVIGTGYNTVSRTHNIGGHAEINAISDAINKLGVQQFNSLDRKQVYLITTFEPCKMCEGAIVENYIKNVIVIKGKPLSHWYKNWKIRLQYQWNKQRADNDTLQDYLFSRHPGYNKARSDL